MRLVLCTGWAKKDLLVKVREIPDDGCDDCVLGMPREHFEEFIQNFNQNSEVNDQFRIIFVAMMESSNQ